MESRKVIVVLYFQQTNKRLDVDCSAPQKEVGMHKVEHLERHDVMKSDGIKHEIDVRILVGPKYVGRHGQRHVHDDFNRVPWFNQEQNRRPSKVNQCQTMAVDFCERCALDAAAEINGKMVRKHTYVQQEQHRDRRGYVWSGIVRLKEVKVP